MSALLTVDGVSKTFARGGLFSARRVDAVKDVSFAVGDGRPEIFTVIGESGSGKSTLARMILGIHAPTRGRLLLDGMDIASVRGGAARHAFMAKVQPIFQNPFEAFNPLKRLDHYLFMTARRFGNAATVVASISAGADIVRVHEVREMKQAAFEETKHLSGAAYFRYIHERVSRMIPGVEYHPAAVQVAKVAEGKAEYGASKEGINHKDTKDTKKKP